MGVFLPIPARLNEIGTTIVDSCYTVHSLLGPGLLESVYALCLAEEIKSRALFNLRAVSDWIFSLKTRLLWNSKLSISCTLFLRHNFSHI